MKIKIDLNLNVEPHGFGCDNFRVWRNGNDILIFDVENKKIKRKKLLDLISVAFFRGYMIDVIDGNRELTLENIKPKYNKKVKVCAKSKILELRG